MTQRRIAYACVLMAALAGRGAGAAMPPNLSGVWQVDGSYPELKTTTGETPPLNAEAAQVYRANMAKRQAGDLSFDPTSKCVSPGLPRILYLPYPFEIVQSARNMVYLFQWNYWNHVVELNNKPQDVPYPLAMGISRGTWNGDTLTIDTIGLRSDNTWLDAGGMPHSDDLHLVERLHLVDGGRFLEDSITIDDKQTFTKAWETKIRFRSLPAGAKIKEDICLDRVDAKQPAVAWPAK